MNEPFYNYLKEIHFQISLHLQLSSCPPSVQSAIKNVNCILRWYLMFAFKKFILEMSCQMEIFSNFQLQKQFYLKR